MKSLLKKIQDLEDVTERQKESYGVTTIGVEPIKVPLIICEDDGTIVFCNDEFCRQIGYSKEQLIGHNTKQYSPNGKAYSRDRELNVELLTSDGQLVTQRLLKNSRL